MTRYHQEPVQCPFCMNEENVTIWDAVDATADPDLRERLLRKTLQTFECRICGTSTPLSEPLMYEDPSLHLRVESRPDLTSRQALLARLAQLRTWPPQPGWQLRLTANTNELIEKIHLHENNLDDRAMALVKLAVQNNPSEGQVVAQIFFAGISGAELLLMVGMQAGDWFQLYLPMAAYLNAVDLLGDTLAETAEGWQLIDRTYAEVLLDGYKAGSPASV